MDEVRLTRCARLPFVLARGEKIGAAQQIKIGLRMIPADLPDNVFDANHKSSGQLIQLLTDH